MPMKVNGDAVVKFRDIASIRRNFRDRETLARVNGQPAVVLEISKRTGENIIESVRKVRDVVAVERTAWPETVNITFSQDKSVQIKDMLRDLQNNVLSAVLLVMIAVIAVLGLRSGILVAIAIPGSFLTAILVLNALGLTVNIVVLFSLILSVGMLVDGAIVVTEYADRKLREGESLSSAYAAAAKRMAWPITASTATTLAAFAPLLFWPGIVGQFMKFLPITLVATLTASLAMALLFVPVLGARFATITRNTVLVAAIAGGAAIAGMALFFVLTQIVGVAPGPLVGLPTAAASIAGAVIGLRFDNAPRALSCTPWPSKP